MTLSVGKFNILEKKKWTTITEELHLIFFWSSGEIKYIRSCDKEKDSGCQTQCNYWNAVPLVWIKSHILKFKTKVIVVS